MRNTNFEKYVMSFYGPNEVYGWFFNNNLALDEVIKAIKQYKKYCRSNNRYNEIRTGGDTIDREMVRDQVFYNRGYTMEEIKTIMNK